MQRHSPALRVTLYVDGSSRGNPGPAGIGIVTFASDDEEHPLNEISKYIGITTNNVAEYEAVIQALKWLIMRQVEYATIKLDSEFVYKQITMQYRARLPHIISLLRRVRTLKERIKSVSVVLIPRTENKHANRLAQRASKKGGMTSTPA
jgi:ribonuclease HI